VRKVQLFAAILACLLLTGCNRSAQFFAMDTVITMEVTGTNAHSALALAQEELCRLEQLLSIHSSEIRALNDRSSAEVSHETAELLEAAISVSAITGGAYDCTVEPVADAWGWYGSAPSVPHTNALEAALEQVGFQCVSLQGNRVVFQKDGMGIDLGGIGKGYAAAKLHKLLQEQGIRSGILSLGGNIRAIGSKPNGQPWLVGIADPEQPASYLCTVAVSDTAVVTSGDYQRFFTENGEAYHHILDPKTGMPADNGLRSVTIVCTDDTLADGLSTALFVMGPDASADFWREAEVGFEAVLITEDAILVTEGLCDAFSCEREYEVIRR
jgi:thiamine biosynthesis lipoprotein